MIAILWWLAETAVVTALLIPLALVLRRVFHKRPAVQHAIWAVILIRFLTPTVIDWPWSIPGFGSSADSLAPDLFVATPFDPDLLPSAAAAPTNPITLANVLAVLALAAWGAGALAITIRMGRRIRRQSARIRRGGAAPATLTHLVREIADQMLVRPVPARVVRGLAAPFIWCFGRPTLAWPEEMLAARSIAASRPIIAHELAHIRRRDHWLAWIELAAMVVWWWNPFFWIVRRNLRVSAEMACDALAIASYPADRCAYAETLLMLSTASPSGSPALVVGMSAGDPSSLERRMSMIASDRVSGKLSRAGVLLAALVALASLPGWSGAQPGQPEIKADVVKQKLAAEKTARLATTRLDDIKKHQRELSLESDRLTAEMQLLLADHAAGAGLDGFEELVAEKLDVMKKMKVVEATRQKLQERAAIEAKVDNARRDLVLRLDCVDADTLGGAAIKRDRTRLDARLDLELREVEVFEIVPDDEDVLYEALTLDHVREDATPMDPRTAEALRAQKEIVLTKMALEATRQKDVNKAADAPPTREQLDAKKTAILEEMRTIEAKRAAVEREGTKADAEKLDSIKKEILERLRWLEARAKELERRKPAK